MLLIGIVAPKTLQKAQYVGFSESAQLLQVVYFGWPRFPVPGSAPRTGAGSTKVLLVQITHDEVRQRLCRQADSGLPICGLQNLKSMLEQRAGDDLTEIGFIIYQQKSGLNVHKQPGAARYFSSRHCLTVRIKVSFEKGLGRKRLLVFWKNAVSFPTTCAL